MKNQPTFYQQIIFPQDTLIIADFSGFSQYSIDFKMKKICKTFMA